MTDCGREQKTSRRPVTPNRRVVCEVPIDQISADLCFVSEARGRIGEAQGARPVTRQ